MPKLYLSGLFYFSLLLACSFDDVGDGSAGSSARFLVDAVGRLLHMAHLRQRFPLWQPLPTSTRNNAQNNDGFREDSGVGDDSQAQQGRRLFSASSARRAHKTRVSGHLLARASVLGTILPESMVCT